MFNITNYSYENCSRKCKNFDHGDRISYVLIHSSVEQEKLAAFIAKTCRNFTHVLDHQGQTALHVATVARKFAIAEWLINNGADVNSPDKKFGQTPLHLAIYYGYFDIAMLLLNYGASFELIDKKMKSPVQYCCKPKNYVTHEQSQIKEQNQLKEIFVWGKNHNYNLGLENKEGKEYPHCLDYFSKQNVSISCVSLSCYHCLYVDDKGELYAVGLGDGGRLGTNKETTLLLPKKIYLTNKHKNERVISVSTARNHSIALTNEDRIFTCGLNTHFQLGQRILAEKSLIMRDIDIEPGIRGFKNVIARDCHCLAYTSDAIYVWGTNCGQFGLPSSETKITQPTKLESFAHSIAYVDSSDAAIVCLTTSDIMLLYAKYKMKTVKKPIVHETIKHIAVLGGNSVNTQDKVSSSEALEILVLTQFDRVFVWSYDDQLYLRCFMNDSFSVKNLFWCDRMVLALATNGVLYKGNITKHKLELTSPQDNTDEFVQQKSRKLDISKSMRCDIELTRIPNIDRITNVSVDQRGESFVILQENSKRYLKIPAIEDDPITFKSLLNETTEFDLLHDIVFHVEDEIFPAHKYIVYSRAEGLRDIVRKYKDKHIYLNFDGLTSKMFELIMKYIYENYTLTLTDIEDVEASFDPYCGLSNLDICTLFREYMGKFGVAKLFDRLMVTNNTDRIKDQPLKLNRLSYPELYDITIKCANNAEIKAHRCVLSTRLEYFNLMLNSSWSESTKDVINLTTVPIEYMEPIINFLYHNDAHLVRKQQYTDSFLYHLLEICDQFIVTRLKNIIEVIMIEKMTAKKCGDMFEFAQTFNCHLLEAACLDYICQNMGRLLENRCLDYLQLESIVKISTYYRKVFQMTEFADFRINIVFGECISDDDLLTFVDDFQIDLMQKCDTSTPKLAKTKKSERPSSDRRNYEKEAINFVKKLSIEDTSPVNNTKKFTEDAILAEAEEISKSLTNESSKWMKVSERKDVKKKFVLAALKSNEVLRNEPKEQESFTPLKITNQKQSSDQIDFDSAFIATGSTTPIESPTEKSAIFNMSLGDFTPLKGVKLSQKQRKRQLSQSEREHSINDSIQSPSRSNKPVWNTPTSPPEQSNVWKIKSTPESSTSTCSTTQPINITASNKSSGQANSSINSSISFNESFFSPSPTKSSLNATSMKSNDSFTKILQDERKQKEYYNKMKSKSLLLTQIEETAIDELKKFYNVDNVFDEHIEIERKSNVTPTVNFAKWKQ